VDHRRCSPVARFHFRVGAWDYSAPLDSICGPNVPAVLPGSNPKLSQENVVHTAYANHLGIGKPINGDSVYNKTVDEASGVASTH
jgi:hypothetical protein